jgi:MoaA/NifB/PqqE/SkfB family radical SAM enzyme
MNLFIYLTKACPYSCRYCKGSCAVEEVKEGSIKSVDFWIEQITRLERFGATHVIFGGKETLLYPNIEELLKRCPLPYEIYSSAFPDLLRPFKYIKHVPKINIGIDYDFDNLDGEISHTQSKSFYAMQELAHLRTKKHKLHIDVRCVMSAYNAHELPIVARKVLEELSADSMTCDFIHADIDGGFDVFKKPDEWEVTDMLLKDKYRYDKVMKFLDVVYLQTMRYENPSYASLRYLNLMYEKGVLEFGKVGVTNDSWHCKGQTIDGFTIDCDGSMRLCPYRKGYHTCKKNIADIKTSDELATVWGMHRKDSKKCPGCTMSLPFKACHSDELAEVY